MVRKKYAPQAVYCQTCEKCHTVDPAVCPRTNDIVVPECYECPRCDAHFSVDWDNMETAPVRHCPKCGSNVEGEGAGTRPHTPRDGADTMANRHDLEYTADGLRDMGSDEQKVQATMLEEQAVALHRIAEALESIDETLEEVQR